jgi:molybdopterin-guanine dinucleotide biosynthesis protein
MELEQEQLNIQTKKRVFGIDPGLSGGISNGTEEILMPTIRVMSKPPVMVQAKDSKGKKQYYKSGSKKGEVKMKVKTNAKFRRELDLDYLFTSFKNADIVIIEGLGTTVGNSAKTTKTTQVNYGKLLACAQLAGCDVRIVPANKWKSDLGVTSDKDSSVNLAEKLTGRSFRKNTGVLMDGEAESFLIWHWFKKY